jgi:hypothetical protein
VSESTSGESYRLAVSAKAPSTVRIPIAFGPVELACIATFAAKGAASAMNEEGLI